MFFLRNLHAAALLFSLIVSISARPTPAGLGAAKRLPAEPESEPVSMMRVKEGSGDATTKSALSNIMVTRASNNQAIGYVSREFYNSATRRQTRNYFYPASYLSVTFNSGTPTEPGNLSVQQSPDEYYLLGFVAGSSDNFSLGKRTITSELASPCRGNSYVASKTSESAVWKWNPGSSSLAASWVNPDGSHPSSVLWYLPLNNALMLVGDPTAFSAQFPGGYQVNLALV
ncbi:hypothetical protein BD779DRAFT_1679564 [Infundibulicybe gibba]|nr:hypothetical protein BD779DRAFT_1679564 [Infundibulicybe gibba]